MSDNPTNKDGIERMWARFRNEWKVANKAVREQKDSHSRYVNFFVEHCRHAPYPTGHLIAWFLPILIGLAAWGWIR